MECESVRVVINREYEFSGTLVHHKNRFFLGNLRDLPILKKAKLAKKAALDDDFGDTFMIITKTAVKSAVKSWLGLPPLVPVPFLGVEDEINGIKATYQENVKDTVYGAANTLWELAFPNIISISLWGSIVKIEFDDDNYGYSTCNLHFPSQEIAAEWEKMLNGNRHSLALPESTV